MLNDIKLLTTFDLLSSIKFIFAVFVVLKCLEVLISAIRNRNKSATLDQEETMPIVLSEQVSAKGIESGVQAVREDGQEGAKDGKIENNSIKNKNIHKIMNKENEDKLTTEQRPSLKKSHKTPNYKSTSENT